MLGTEGSGEESTKTVVKSEVVDIVVSIPTIHLLGCGSRSSRRREGSLELGHILIKFCKVLRETSVYCCEVVAECVEVVRESGSGDVSRRLEGGNVGEVVEDRDGTSSIGRGIIFIYICICTTDASIIRSIVITVDVIVVVDVTEVVTESNTVAWLITAPSSGMIWRHSVPGGIGGSLWVGEIHLQN